MKIVSWNVNGLMACMEKDGFTSISALQPDIVCCQEVKTQRRPKVLPGYFHYWETGKREGYAGVLTMAKREPLDVQMGLGRESLDREGRIITLEYETVYIINAYSPNSQESPDRRAFRARWDEALLAYVRELMDTKPVILCGDLNVTRAAIDVFPENTRIQEKEKGYISPERDNLEALLDVGFVDAYRHLYPEQKGAYTWWSARFDKRSRNDGWRLDYFLVDRRLARKISQVTHCKEILGSDHCPIELKINLSEQLGEIFDRSALKTMRPSIDFPEEFLKELWESTDWQAAKEILADLQKQIALAAYRRDNEKITALQAIIGATGRYQEVWKRQQGRCYYCGRPILPDQARDVTQINMADPDRPFNLAYVHELCKANELSIQEVLGDTSVYTHQELLDASQEILNVNDSESRVKLAGPFRENWPYMPLKRWFAKQQQASITLTFKEIEAILKRQLPESAKKYTAKWYTRPDQNAMAEAWQTEGYKLHKLNLEKQKVTFHRNIEGESHVTLPRWLTSMKIPDAARVELEDYLVYLRKKYGFN